MVFKQWPRGSLATFQISPEMLQIRPIQHPSRLIHPPVEAVLAVAVVIPARVPALVLGVPVLVLVAVDKSLNGIDR